jgi:hypothetical protein
MKCAQPLGEHSDVLVERCEVVPTIPSIAGRFRERDSDPVRGSVL